MFFASSNFNDSVEYVKVKALQGIPEFMGIDGKIYKLILKHTKDQTIDSKA